MASPKIKLLKRIFIYLSIYFFVFSKPQKQHLDKEKEYLIYYIKKHYKFIVFRKICKFKRKAIKFK